MTFDELIKNLNEEQRDAVRALGNTVVSAGAGSGKTTVLSARYVYLIVEKKFKVDEILTLTFTKKAAMEMYNRIYADLKKISSNAEAEAAVKEFKNAQILTLDAFCNSIARQACRSFGISPNFTIDIGQSEKIAEETAMDFFLEHRKNETLQKIMGGLSISDFVNSFFAKILKKYVFVSKPLDLKTSLKLQDGIIVDLFSKYITEIEEALAEINSFEYLDNSKKAFVFLNEIKKTAASLPELPLTPLEAEFKIFLDSFLKFTAVPLPKGSVKEFAVIRCKELVSSLRNLSASLLNIYNFIKNRPLMSEMFELISKLQDKFIEKKRISGVLQYGDVAQLALDSLKNNIELRNYYKNSIKAVMIDEFQDNNSMQKELLFLLAEKPEKALMPPLIPSTEDICNNKLFFVGDEKQSIYAFRGADVSVFRRLTLELNNKKRLDTNYRTEEKLLNVFNILFEKIFYSKTKKPDDGSDVPIYEAFFDPIKPCKNNISLSSGISILIGNKTLIDENAETNPAFLQALECEAAALALHIRYLHDSGFLVKDKTGERPCKWSDFAILLRASTNQGFYERFLRQAGIPYTASQQKGIFYDAPLNDIYSILRLAVYPSDRGCYAQVLKTPFAALSEEGFTEVMLSSAEPFSPEMCNLLTGTDKEIFSLCAELFNRIQNYIKLKTNAEIITALWYDEGYRYLLLQNSPYQKFIELYDYLFQLACQADTNGLTVSQFTDELYNYINGGKHLDEMEIPTGGRSGDSVIIMSVHKSKGLEFPIVCIPDCSNGGEVFKKDGMVFYTEEAGLSMHLPALKEYKLESTHPIFEQMRRLENAKLAAEIKRLFYVAVTRAEVKVVLSGCTEKLKADKSNVAEEGSALTNSLDEVCSAYTISREQKTLSFFDLLIPSLADQSIRASLVNENALYFEEIIPMTKADVAKKFSAPAKFDKTVYTEGELKAVYSSANIKEFYQAKKQIVPVTLLEQKSDGSIFVVQKKNNYVKLASKETEDRELTAAELGTLAHSAIEAAFSQRTPELPQKEKKIILQFKENFFNSNLGKKAVQAKIRHTEYGFITKYAEQTVTGKIDLLFEFENTVYIVDYKTDKTENPESHKLQMSVYKKAITDLYTLKNADTKPCIKSFLFYLRSGNAYELA